MNEQIKAIGRQAGLVFIEDGVYGQRWYSSKCGLDASEYEKLVEVIVEECVAQCWTVSELEHKGDVISECSKRMRKHFGVEE